MEEDRKQRGGKKSRNTSLPSIPAYPCRALHSTNELYFAKKTIELKDKHMFSFTPGRGTVIILAQF